MEKQQDSKSFTCSFPKIADVLLSPAWVAGAFSNVAGDAGTPEEMGAKRYTAIWDTGATSCVLGERVVKECKLKPIGMAKVNTADGEHDAFVYLISLFLPNRFAIPQIVALSGKIKGADMLIGMDVISEGDFAVTNIDGKTTMTFRMPSCERINFVKNVGGREMVKVGSTAEKVGRNEPCPCGSGKKYKRCCGK